MGRCTCTGGGPAVTALTSALPKAFRCLPQGQQGTRPPNPGPIPSCTRTDAYPGPGVPTFIYVGDEVPQQLLWAPGVSPVYVFVWGGRHRPCGEDLMASPGSLLRSYRPSGGRPATAWELKVTTATTTVRTLAGSPSAAGSTSTPHGRRMRGLWHTRLSVLTLTFLCRSSIRACCKTRRRV